MFKPCTKHVRNSNLAMALGMAEEKISKRMASAKARQFGWMLAVALDVRLNHLEPQVGCLIETNIF